MKRKRVLVLGIGNLLARDDGVGIHVIRRLKARSSPESAPAVRYMEAGTTGHRVLAEMEDADRLIVVDCMEAADGCQPGDVRRFDASELTAPGGPRRSAHGFGLTETLSMARTLGTLPPTVVFGIQAGDVTPYSEELSPEVARAVPMLLELVETEIAEALAH